MRDVFGWKLKLKLLLKQLNRPLFLREDRVLGFSLVGLSSSAAMPNWVKNELEILRISRLSSSSTTDRRLTHQRLDIFRELTATATHSNVATTNSAAERSLCVGRHCSGQ